MTDPSAPPLAFGAVPPPVRWLARGRNRALIARFVVAALAGSILGIALTNQAAAGRREAAALTKEKYAATYDAHKRKLEANDTPALALIAMSILMALAVAALYEVGGALILPAVARIDDTRARREDARRRLVRDDTDV